VVCGLCCIFPFTRRINLPEHIPYARTVGLGTGTINILQNFCESLLCVCLPHSFPPLAGTNLTEHGQVCAHGGPQLWHHMLLHTVLSAHCSVCACLTPSLPTCRKPTCRHIRYVRMVSLAAGRISQHIRTFFCLCMRHFHLSLAGNQLAGSHQVCAHAEPWRRHHQNTAELM
jgi:hypothetical protein